MSDTSSPLTVMSSPLSELSEPPGSPEPFELPPTVEEAPLPIEDAGLQDRESVEPEQDQLDQPIVQAEAEINLERFDLFGDADIVPNQSDVITIEDESVITQASIDLSRETPVLIHQSGNIVQVRWAGTEGEDDIVIEVDENGYEVTRETDALANQQQDEVDEEVAEEDLQAVGQRGVRSLLDICRGSEFAQLAMSSGTHILSY